MDEQKIKTQFEKLKRVERTQKRESTQRGCGAAWQPLRRRKTSLDYTLIAGITLEAVLYYIKYEMVGAASFLQAQPHPIYPPSYYYILQQPPPWKIPRT